jgi:hypothetical protein
MRPLRRIRRYLEGLSAYASLLLLAVPVISVELLKLAAVFVLGDGHWLTGTIVMLCAYALSIFLVERLFTIVKPKLLTLPWFAALWTWFVGIRRRVFGWFRKKWAPGGRRPAARSHAAAFKRRP